LILTVAQIYVGRFTAPLHAAELRPSLSTYVQVMCGRVGLGEAPQDHYEIYQSA
jgi:hypothetical protein